MEAGPGQGWGEMVQDQGLAAALGLGPFPRIIHDERVKVGQWTQGQIGKATAGEAHAFARQPFQVAVLPEVDHPVSPVNRLQPVVGGQVVVGGRQIRAVVAELRIPLIAAAGLNQHHNRTKTAAMDGKALRLQVVVLVRWSPALQHRLAGRGG